ncbi:MAG: type II restriction endonuclease [Oscillospiraceae bacterium]|nr:type II restriction endonuclease [Oscillospiraceae bacterium]
MDDVLILEARKRFHKNLIDSGLWSVSAIGVPSNADIGDKEKAKRGIYNVSTLISQRTASIVGVPQIEGDKKRGTSAGDKFEDLIAQFIRETFPYLQHLRPGKWTVLSLGNKSNIKSSSFAQYEHLEYLSELVRTNKKLESVLGNDYVVAPDVVVYRSLYEDEEINLDRLYINDDVARMAALRKKTGGKPILHASVSAKWTMRSDRAQNSRTEALNLIRNRKGNLPHIMVVTNEPLPSRLASLALGTGDIDCLYHCALYELYEAIKDFRKENNRDDIIDDLENLIAGKRLKDISDLPLDLSV